MSALPKIAAQVGTPERARALLEGLSAAEAAALLGEWSLWALPYQQVPDGQWSTWIVRAGRGGGKTHTGSAVTNWVARQRKLVRRGEIGIIGRTYTEARQVMIEGDSGILRTAPPDFTPKWEPGNGVVTWPNGVKGRVFSADKPETMRGPNWAFVWGDEAGYWPDFQRTWCEVVEPAIRIGWSRALITSTPKPSNPFLRELEKRRTTVVTRGSTFDNPYLSSARKEEMREMYGGTRVGRQELLGEYVDASEAALWRREQIEFLHEDPPEELGRIVVAIDPAGTSHASSDETGIVVAARVGERCYVLEDLSGRFKPHEWATRAILAYERHRADCIVVETNFGGEMVENTIAAIDPKVRVKSVNASRGKWLRAEPVAALYERGRVYHCEPMPELEDQMCQWEPGSKGWSPDRMDAMVYAVTELMLTGGGPIAAYGQMGSVFR